MKLQIGQVIKHLRKEREITQEELAEILGVSCQSVSRWELGVCYPDMELLPVIADYFQITVDKLIGVKKSMEETKVQQLLTLFQEALSIGDVDACITIAREGVSEYPNNYTLLNKLMYALFLSTDETGNIPDWKENMQKYDSEIIALGERIRKYCPHQNIRLEATARLGFHHCEMGRQLQGRAILETLPPQKLCRETHMWWALKEEEKLDFTRAQIRDAYTNLSAGLYNMAYGRLLPDKELVTVYEKMIELDNWLYDEAYETHKIYDYDAQFFCAFARVYARLNMQEECLVQLRLAAKYAEAFDNRPDSTETDSLLIGKQKWQSTLWETTDSRTCKEIMRDTWMAHKDFDGIRNSTEFQEILELL